jgi:hypothetical protein
MNEQNNVTRKEWHEVFLQAILFLQYPSLFNNLFVMVDSQKLVMKK